MMGRFLRSLYVGRRTVYLSPEEAFLLSVDIALGKPVSAVLYE